MVYGNIELKGTKVLFKFWCSEKESLEIIDILRTGIHSLKCRYASNSDILQELNKWDVLITMMVADYTRRDKNPRLKNDPQR